MESIALFIGLVLIVVLVYVFFFRKTKNTKDKNSYYLKRFLRNREQSLKHINQVEVLAEENKAWDKRAFSDRDLTFSQYLEALKSKYSEDYSANSYKILNKNKLNYAQKQEYTKKLIEQSEELYLMEVDLGILNKLWKK